MGDTKHNFRERERERELEMRLVPSSVHLPYSFMKEIAELNYPQSKFIRDAVAEKLDRETGYDAALERLESEIAEHKATILSLEAKSASYKLKRQEWVLGKTKERVGELSVAVFLTSQPKSQADFEALVIGKLSQEGVEAERSIVCEAIASVWQRLAQKSGEQSR